MREELYSADKTKVKIALSLSRKREEPPDSKCRRHSFMDFGCAIMLSFYTCICHVNNSSIFLCVGRALL